MEKKKLSKAEQEEISLASYWDFKFKEAMVAKAPYIKNWQMYWDAYYGDYFKDSKKPDYKSDLVSNYIFSIIETIRPIMLDNDPAFQAMPRQPDGILMANDMQEALSYEFDRENMRTKMFRELITELVTGTMVFFLPWDSKLKQVKAIPVNPFNIFPDPLATSVEDSEYMIYASYNNAEVLRRMFPNKADRLQGSAVNYGELVYNNERNANIDNQILILEVWTRDYESKSEDGKVKYPNGRVITVCPEIGVVLSDKANPYSDATFPFRLCKDYDVPGKFWGEGEVSQLISPQKHMNELNNAIVDNAKSTANMPWLVDKNSGIGQGKITSRPGLILRRNPGTMVERMQAPTMPQYVINAVETYKGDMEQISGVFDTLKGNSETGVYTAQGILALQEAGQARVRLKVKILEEFLGQLASLWVSRMGQFWTDKRYVRVTRADGTYDVKEFKKDVFKYDYDVRITAGSTMPVNRGAMLDLMIRLAQTPMPDGQNLVDREAVVQYLPEEVKSQILQRMNGEKNQMTMQIEEITQQLQAITEESQTNDESIIQAIEQITQTLEGVNKKILQVDEERVKLEEERKREDEHNKIKTQSYNEGYRDGEKIASPMDADAESSMTEPSMLSGESEFASVGDDNSLADEIPLPDDILEGIEELSDDELELLISQNPELAELLR